MGWQGKTDKEEQTADPALETCDSDARLVIQSTTENTEDRSESEMRKEQGMIPVRVRQWLVEQRIVEQRKWTKKEWSNRDG